MLIYWEYYQNCIIINKNVTPKSCNEAFFMDHPVECHCQLGFFFFSLSRGLAYLNNGNSGLKSISEFYGYSSSLKYVMTDNKISQAMSTIKISKFEKITFSMIECLQQLIEVNFIETSFRDFLYGNVSKISVKPIVKIFEKFL